MGSWCTVSVKFSTFFTNQGICCYVNPGQHHFCGQRSGYLLKWRLRRCRMRDGDEECFTPMWSSDGQEKVWEVMGLEFLEDLQIEGGVCVWMWETDWCVCVSQRFMSTEALIMIINLTKAWFMGYCALVSNMFRWGSSTCNCSIIFNTREDRMLWSKT